MYGNTIAIFKGLNNEFGYESYESYHEYKERITPLVAETNKDKDGFFRVGATFERTKNESIGFGYNGITHYSSTYNRYVNNLLQKMGMAQSWMWSSYFGSTMVTDAVFSVRYVISEHPVSPYYSPVKESGSAKLYHNSNALSIGTAVNEQSLFGFQFSDNSFESQNRLIKALTNSNDDCFNYLENTATDIGNAVEYNFVSNGMPVYAFFTTSEGDGDLLVNGENTAKLFTNETRCVQYIGTFNEGENVKVAVNNSGNIEGKLCYLNKEIYERSVAALKSKELHVDNYHNGSVSGTVSANEGDVLFTSIPYDQGWRAYVDGKEVELKTFADSLITIPLTAGTHKIKITYTPVGFTEGICISLVPSLLVLMLLLVTKKLPVSKPK